MQRQSLGSPVSKLYIHGAKGANKNDAVIFDDPERTVLPSHSNDLGDADDYCKAMKTRRRLSSPPSSSFSVPSSTPQPGKLVHFIPLITLLCFFVLYLVSHDPSSSGKTSIRNLTCSFPISNLDSEPLIPLCLRRFGSVQWSEAILEGYRYNALRISCFSNSRKLYLVVLDICFTDSSDIREVDAFSDLLRGDVLAIRNLKNLLHVEVKSSYR